MDTTKGNGKRAASPGFDHSHQADKHHHKDGTIGLTAAPSVSKSLKRKTSDSKIDAREPSSQKRVKADTNKPCLALEAVIPETTVEAPPAPVKLPASLTTIEPEVRLEILRHLLLLERNQVVTYRSARLFDHEFISLARDPYASGETLHPGWHTTVANDNFLQTGLQRKIDYRPQVQILRVCKQLRDEGEDIFYSENHYIGIHGAPDDLIKKLRRLGVGPRRWTGTGERLLPQPVLQIDFRPEQLDFRPDRWLLFPPSDLRRVSLALYLRDVFEPPNMADSQRMHLRIFPGIRLLKAFGQEDIAGVKELLQNDLIDWIGHEMTGCLADGMRTRSWRDSSVDLGPSFRVHAYPSFTNMPLHIRQIRDDFESAYALHTRESLPAAMQVYLDVRDRIWFVAKNCAVLSWPFWCRTGNPSVQCRILCMLSWILFHIASGPSSMVSRQWRVLFAHRALTLPSYVPLTEWKLRIHVLVAGMLTSFPGLRNLRVHHLVRAGALLELKDENPVSQQLCELNTMVTTKDSDALSLEDIMVLIQQGLKNEMEKKYGVEVAIPHSVLDDELDDDPMGAFVDTTLVWPSMG
jgi:hypothetical protein